MSRLIEVKPKGLKGTMAESHKKSVKEKSRRVFVSPDLVKHEQWDSLTEPNKYRFQMFSFRDGSSIRVREELSTGGSSL